jgi:probable HAF family extracellular repeat protein
MPASIRKSAQRKSSRPRFHRIAPVTARRSEANVESGLSTCFTSIALLIALALPLPAQQPSTQHHHYELIDLGTFGGPQSRIDYAVPLNDRGLVSGSADTPDINPYYGNDNPTFFPDPYIEHTFGWKNGVSKDLGSLPGGGISQPNCMNQHGDVAGNASNSVIDPMGGWPESRAVLYKNGQIFDLGTLDSGTESAATCINNEDVVIGFAGDTVPDPFSLVWGTQTHAVQWTRSRGMQDLGNLGGPDAVPFTIDDSGRIGGISYTNTTPNPTTGLPTLDPFLWQDGTMTDLGGLGGTASELYIDGWGSNSKGQVVGNSDLPGDVYYHPFLWTSPGPMQDLGTLGGNYGSGNAINEAGKIVGWATNAGDQAALAFFWKNGTMTNLGVLSGELCSYAFAINANDQVSGASDDCASGNSLAFLWERGSIVDLNTLVPPNSGLQLTLGGYINERGEITAEGVLSSGDTHAALLIPCDENHPGVDGCDYSLVEATAVTSAASALRPASPQLPSMAPAWRDNRFSVLHHTIGPRN